LRIAAPSAQRLSRCFWLTAALAFGAAADERALKLADGAEIRYEVIAPGAPGSASATADHLLSLLAEGKIDDAAALSNAPERRAKVLRQYQDAVGEAEFRRIFGLYGKPPNRLVAEIVIGERHLLIWDLAEANHRLAGQYFVRAGERFVLEDAVTDERTRLQRVLAAYRDGRLKP
jgi:hypothetical protein